MATKAKRILSVTIKRMYDDSPDTSWMGEYSDKRSSEFSIDRAHSLDCASVSPDARAASAMLYRAWEYMAAKSESEVCQARGEAMDILMECSEQAATECDCGGEWHRRERRYFNPSFNYVDAKGNLLPGNTAEDVRKYVAQDYERMERIMSGDICFIGIRADAEVQIASNVVQEITSGGLWGIESDDAFTAEETEQEQLADLKTELLALGFSKRAIATAFKSVERDGDANY